MRAATSTDVSGGMGVPEPIKDNPITVYPSLRITSSLHLHCSFIHLSTMLLGTIHTSNATSLWCMSVKSLYSKSPCGTTFPAFQKPRCITLHWLESVSASSASISAPPCTAGPIRNPRAWLTQHRGSGSDKFTTKIFCEE